MKKVASIIVTLGFLSLGLTILGVAAICEAGNERFHKSNN